LVEDVEETGDKATWLRITANKTASGIRKVPLVDPQARSMLRSRVAASKAAGADALFMELPVNRFGDRSKSLAQRLSTKLRAGVGAGDPSLVAAHGWRHRARTAMEARHVPPSTADWFMGHARPGEGLSRYSKPSDEQLIEAARAIPLPV
jgi:hypothetical protein